MTDKVIHPKNKKKWRLWLEKNHLKEKKVGLVMWKKHTGKPTIGHKESMEEAICFGWIDTTIKRLDEDRYMRWFARRNEKSRWSKNTLSYAKEMTKQDKMSDYGMKMYELGLKKKVIDHGFPRNPETPEELKKLLNKSKIAKENFEKMAPSSKRNYIYWIEKAKMSETRKRRIKEVFKKVRENKRLGL